MLIIETTIIMIIIMVITIQKTITNLIVIKNNDVYIHIYIVYLHVLHK